MGESRQSDPGAEERPAPRRRKKKKTNTDLAAALEARPVPAAPAPPPPKKRSALVPVLAAVLGLGVVGAAGFFSYKYFGKPRVSQTPCGKGALALVGSLRSSMTITLYATGGTPKLDRFIVSVSAVLGDLAEASKGKLVYKLVLVKDEVAADEAKAAGLQEFVVTESDDPNSTAIRRIFSGLAFSYGGEKDSIPVLSPEQDAGLPFWIVNKVRELRARADNLASRFGVVSSKGGVSLSEPSLVSRTGAGPSPSMKSVFTQSLPYYQIEDLDLHGGDEEIDKSYSGIILLQPESDYTEKELRRVDQFLMRGGKSVVVIASAVNVRPSEAKMRPFFSAHGVEKLLDGYGVEMQNDLVEDWLQPVSMKIAASTGTSIDVRLPGAILVKHDSAAAPEAQTLDTTFVPFFRLDEVVVPFASSLVLHPEKQPSATLRAVARTSPNASSVTSAPVTLSPVGSPAPPDKQEYRQRIIAAALEGKIRSAFAGRPGDGVSTPDVSPEPSRLFVLSSSQFTVNPLARASNPPAEPGQMAMMGATPTDEDLAMLAQPYAQKYLTTTILAVKNTLDWASADDATVSCSALLSDVTKDANKK